jgi:protein-S-isoprenylcysteine O-methyltransferase Ste14
MTALSRAARPDLGKLVMVPAAAVMLVADVAALTHGRGDGAATALRWLGAALVCLFYLLVIWCYLRRPPATATSGSATAHLAAVLAPLTPFTFPLLPAAASGAVRQAGADLLLVAGTAWSVWALRALGRNLSVIAQARAVAERGPYRWVRHPLYAGEIVSSLGLAIGCGTLAGFGVWAFLCALQVYRAVREEQLLVRTLPGYRGYRSRTAALLPGIF